MSSIDTNSVIVNKSSIFNPTIFATSTQPHNNRISTYKNKKAIGEESDAKQQNTRTSINLFRNKFIHH